MKKQQPLGKAFSEAPQHDPTPFGKGTPNADVLANVVHSATNVLTPRTPASPHYRAAKTAAHGNRGRQVMYKGK